MAIIRIFLAQYTRPCNPLSCPTLAALLICYVTLGPPRTFHTSVTFLSILLYLLVIFVLVRILSSKLPLAALCYLKEPCHPHHANSGEWSRIVIAEHTALEA